MLALTRCTKEAQMGRTASTKKAPKGRSKNVTTTKDKATEKPKTSAESDALLLAAIKAQMSDSEIADFVRDQRLENIAKGTYESLMDNIKSVGDDEEWEGKAIILLPCEPFIDWIDPADYTSDEEDDEGEDDDEEYVAKTVIKDLRRYIKAEGVTQGWVAEQAEVTQATVSNWLAGTSEPRQKNCAALATFLYE